MRIKICPNCGITFASTKCAVYCSKDCLSQYTNKRRKQRSKQHLAEQLEAAQRRIKNGT